MSHTLRAFLVLCALALSMALALLKPLSGRADDGTTPITTVDPVTSAQPVAKLPAARKLASARAAMSQRVVAYAKRFVGVRYVYGGSSPRSGFDCSGFVRYVYAHFGVSLPHSSYAQFGDGRRVSRRSLRPGDLVFFDGVGHVGLYVGNDRFIHAPHTGTRVQVTPLAGWYSSRFSGARRLRLS
jgi:cell wall-associated NlpC family hydrolase